MQTTRNNIFVYKHIQLLRNIIISDHSLLYVINSLSHKCKGLLYLTKRFNVKKNVAILYNKCMLHVCSDPIETDYKHLKSFKLVTLIQKEKQKLSKYTSTFYLPL